MEVGDVVGDEVGHVDLLHPMPAWLDRIQLGGVGGEMLEEKPIGTVGLKVRLCTAVGGQAVPKDDGLLSTIEMV